MPRTSTHPVALVVFVNAEGADAHDAINVAERIVLAGLADAGTVSSKGEVRIGRPLGRNLERHLDVGAVLELGRAHRAGLIGLTTSADAYPR